MPYSDGAPIVCGGYSQTARSSSDSCYVFSVEEDTWRQAEKLPAVMDYAGTDSLSTWGLVMAGGGDGPVAD